MIRLLSEDTIQKIAAGEVIERPVSVVKELIENAIDAGSTEITCEIREGGKSYIRVTDNGCGIPEDQFETAFKRHATSKINEFNDLYLIHSLGFRGEALASIVSVAKVTARSRTADSKIGTELKYENGTVISKQPVAMPVGTEIIVDDIFYNIPVRRGFMKSQASEASKISALLYSLAIGNPSVSISYIKDDRRVFHTKKENTFNENLLLLFGMDYYDSLISINSSDENTDYKISGRMGNNTFYRANRQMQYVYVNGRYVEDDGVRDAVEEKFRAIIPNGRFPAFQIFIETDPKNIDINIHPNKQKIKFQNKDILLASIGDAVRKGLFSSTEIPLKSDTNSSVVSSFNFSSASDYEKIVKNYVSYDSSDNSYNNPYKDFRNSHDDADSQFNDFSSLHDDIDDSFNDLNDAFSFENLADASEVYSEASEAFNYEGNKSFRNQVSNVYEEDKAYQNQELSFISDYEYEEDEKEDTEDDNRKENLPKEESIRYIGTAFRTYLLFEDLRLENMYLIDQHAAHERINYEKFLKQFRNHTVITQKLLKPMELSLTDMQKIELQKKMVLLDKLGYDIFLSNEEKAIIKSVPTLFKSPTDDKLFYDILDMEFNCIDEFDQILNAIATKACKASVKQGDDLSVGEVWELYHNLAICDYPYTCPHGRPTMIKFKKQDLEKMFMRIK